jgi:probable F420-dependent oxidoreductase
MRIGVSLPNLGLSANPAAVVRGAQHAEQLGYDTVWVADRLLYPVRPRNPYPATADGSLPAYYKEVLDPLESLTFAAAHTSRIGLGTSIIAIPFYGPVVLARRLTTIDVLSGGRLRVGFGLGWSDDEFEAVGSMAKGRAVRASEFLQVLTAIWTTNPVEFHGQFFTIPPSFIGPKPIQKPRPPVFLAAYTASALKRVAAYADGWQPNGAILLGEMPRMLADLRAAAAAAGRDPSALLLNVVATAALTPQPITGRRAFFTGSVDQVREDIARARALGTTELIFELDLGPPLDELLRTMERFRRLVD